MARKLNYSLIVIALIIVSVLLGIWFYKIGYTDGNREGYLSGYQNGINSDNKTAWHDGYDIGYKYGFEYNNSTSQFWTTPCAFSLSTPRTHDIAWSQGWDVGVKEMVEKCNGDNQYPNVAKDVELDKVQEFLYLDTTDKIPFSDDFNCLGYALTLKMNAAKRGIRCAVVILYYQDQFTGKLDTGHAVNAFQILNKSLIHVEPQSDGIRHDLSVGGSYKYEGWKTDYPKLIILPSKDGKLQTMLWQDKRNDCITRIVTIW